MNNFSNTGVKSIITMRIENLNQFWLALIFFVALHVNGQDISPI